MSAIKLSNENSLDLEKTTRILVHKIAQVVVQSRCGDPLKSQCKPPMTSRAHWFNLNIVDMPEITEVINRSFQTKSTNSATPLCIEISVKTIDGDSVVLETWYYGVIPRRVDPALKISCSSVYTSMGSMLKSLLTVARVTPAYKISRKQNPKAYVVCYRIFMGKPNTSFRDDYKHIRVGQIGTAAGLIHLAVSYRTKIRISQIKPEKPLATQELDFRANPRDDSEQEQQNNEGLDYSMEEMKIEDYMFVVVGKIPAKASKCNKPSFSNDSDTVDSSKASAEGTDTAVTALNEKLAALPAPRTWNNKTEKRAIYTSWRKAPRVQPFNADKTVEEQIGDLTKVLANYEIEMAIYNDIVSSL